MSKKFYY